jgi:hypothetical protein
MEWMHGHWKDNTLDETFYQALGVDGSNSSFLAFLGNIEHKCPPVPESPSPLVEDPAWPECERRVLFMKVYWDSEAIPAGDAEVYRANDVDGSDFSVRRFLGNVEHFCPPVDPHAGILAKFQRFYDSTTSMLAHFTPGEIATLRRVAEGHKLEGPDGRRDRRMANVRGRVLAIDQERRA